MPWCKIGVGNPTLVDSPDDCRAAGGSIVPAPGGDAGPPDKKTDKCCFVRNVITRGLGELILDLGVAKKLSHRLARNVDIPRGPEPKKPADSRKTLTLSPTLRLRLASRIARSIFKLAATYETGLDFQVHVFRETQRGRKLLDDYQHYLPEAYEIARNDYTLLNDLASAWLDVHSFAKAMVTVKAAGAKAPSNARGRALKERSYKQGRELIRRFREASKDDGFRALMHELDSELAEYRGLNAERALAKLAASPATRSPGGGRGVRT